jgi:arginine decarboxylase
VAGDGLKKPRAELTHSGSTKELHDSATLADAIEQHCVKEKVSFHTPGHKGGTHFTCAQNLWAMDVTELPGLDELAYASGVLARVQERAAQAFAARASFISTNGATAALMAAIVACANRNTHILVPRNVHRSAVNALVLTGLEPVWYEPSFNSEWNVWGAIEQDSFASIVEKHASRLAGALVVSPTYAGAISDIESMAEVCHRFEVPLIVDEAHGAHAPNAVAAGADLVIHSLHKTLSAMTQTGLLHVGLNSLVSTDDVRLALNMVQSSSPNYVLMASVESAVNEFVGGSRVANALKVAGEAQQQLTSRGIPLYTSARQDAFHLLIKLPGIGADELCRRLAEEGVYAESVLGNGVLLLLGCGTIADDIPVLIDALECVPSGTNPVPAMSVESETIFGQQVLSPKLAYFGRTEMVSLSDAVGRVAAECVAPCPPGNPVLVPGQRVTARALEFCKLPVLRVVVESQKGDQ